MPNSQTYFVVKNQRKNGKNLLPKAPNARVEFDQTDGFVLASWERAALLRLMTLLPHSVLETLLGSLTYTVRKLREMETGHDVRGTKTDLANALIIAHGRDLLAEKTIRTAIAHSCKVTPPAAWAPGRESSFAFTERCGLPEELAGILAQDRLPDFEQLDGTPVIPRLMGFQREIYSKLLRRLQGETACRAIASLPTGAGKTRLMVETIRQFWMETDRSVVIWLAHTEELCEQAMQCFKDVWETSAHVTPMTAVRFWGPYSRRVDMKTLFQGRALLVSTPQRLLNLLDRSAAKDSPLIRALCGKLSLTVVDEAHRAGAPTYIRLASLISKRNPSVAFVGLTATPFRTEYTAAEDGIAALKETFQELVEASSLGRSPREALQGMQVLSRLTIKEIKTHIDLQIPDKAELPIGKLPPRTQQDVDQLLKSESDLPRRRLAILPQLLAIAREPNTSILYFGPTVNDAQAMTFLLRTRGISSAFVGADTRTPTRRATVQEFKEGKIKVLCNCEVLTTGFDAPRVTHIVIARPTVSRVLWEQMIGRGMRGPKFGGTPHCIVYDCVDNFKGDPGKVRGFIEYKQAWYRELRGDISPAKPRLKKL